MRRSSLRARRLRRPRSTPIVWPPIPHIIPRAALRSAAWWGPGLAALLVIVVLSGAGAATAASRSRMQAPRHPWIGRASPPDALPAIARWQDIKDGTAYALHVTAALSTNLARGGNLFTFTTPTGDEIAGLLPLAQLADLSFAQATSPDPATLGGCTGGTLIASNTTSAAGAPASTTGTAPVEFALQARFDQYLLVAYVQILYAPASDKTLISAVCAGDTSAAGVTSLTMSAGCTATSCGSPLDDAMAAPPAYEQALIHAMQERGVDGWSAVWALTSRAVTAQYAQADFATLMNQLSDKNGTITAMAPTSGAPAVRWDAGGQAYYTVVESVTYTRGGTSKTVQITSYYLLEGGAWVFWFSEPYSS